MYPRDNMYPKDSYPKAKDYEYPMNETYWNKPLKETFVQSKPNEFNQYRVRDNTIKNINYAYRNCEDKKSMYIPPDF